MEFIEKGLSEDHQILNFTYLLWTIGLTNLPDLKSLATSGLQLLMFDKRPKMAPLTDLGRIFVARHFAWPNQLVVVDLLFLFCNQILLTFLCV